VIGGGDANPAGPTPEASAGSNPDEEQPGAAQSPGQATAAFPEGGPAATALVLSCPEPKEAAAFYRRIFGVKSEPRTRPEEHAIYSIGGIRLVLRRDLSSEERRGLGVGTVKRHRGWGLTLALQVPDFSACLRRVRRIPDALLYADPKGEIMTVRDPSGYILEISGE